MCGQYSISNNMYTFPERDVVMHEFQCESPRSLNMCWTSGDVHCSLAQVVYEPKRLSVWDVHMMTPPMTPRDAPIDYRRFSGMAMSISTPTPTIASFLPEKLNGSNNTVWAANQRPPILSPNAKPVPINPNVSQIPFPALQQPNAWASSQGGYTDQQILSDHKSVCDVMMDVEMVSTPTMPNAPLSPRPFNNFTPPITPPTPRATSPRLWLAEKSLTNEQSPPSAPRPATPDLVPLRPTRPRANAMLSRVAQPASPQPPPPRNTKTRTTKKSPLRSFFTLPSLDAAVATSTSSKANSSMTTPSTSTGPFTPQSAVQPLKLKQKSKPKLGLKVQPPTNMNVGIVPINDVTSPLSPYTPSSSKTEHPPPLPSHVRPRVASPPTRPSAIELALLWAEMERFKDVPLPVDDADECCL